MKYSLRGILGSDTTEWTGNPHNDMDDSHRQNDEQEKLDAKETNCMTPFIRGSRTGETKLQF